MNRQTQVQQHGAGTAAHISVHGSTVRGAQTALVPHVGSHLCSCCYEPLKFLSRCKPVPCHSTFRTLTLCQVGEATRLWLYGACGMCRTCAAGRAVNVLHTCKSRGRGLRQQLLLLLRVATPALTGAEVLCNLCLWRVEHRSHQAGHNARLPSKVNGAVPRRRGRLGKMGLRVGPGMRRML